MREESDIPYTTNHQTTFKLPTCGCKTRTAEKVLYLQPWSIDYRDGHFSIEYGHQTQRHRRWYPFRHGEYNNPSLFFPSYNWFEVSNEHGIEALLFSASEVGSQHLKIIGQRYGTGVTLTSLQLQQVTRVTISGLNLEQETRFEIVKSQRHTIIPVQGSEGDFNIATSELEVQYSIPTSRDDNHPKDSMEAKVYKVENIEAKVIEILEPREPIELDDDMALVLRMNERKKYGRNKRKKHRSPPNESATIEIC